MRKEIESKRLKGRANEIMRERVNGRDRQMSGDNLNNEDGLILPSELD